MTKLVANIDCCINNILADENSTTHHDSYPALQSMQLLTID